MLPRMELSHDEALRIIETIRRAIEESGAGGAAVAVADPHGELVAFLRTDGCRPSAITLAMNKAYTAAREHIETADLGPIMAAKGFPLTNFGDLRFLSFPGGVPIVVVLRGPRPEPSVLPPAGLAPAWPAAQRAAQRRHLTMQISSLY